MAKKKKDSGKSAISPAEKTKTGLPQEPSGKAVAPHPALSSGSISNSTEHKQLEQALKESEERFRDLFEKAPLGYQSLDIDGRFIEINHAWLETLGYTREEVIGKWFGDFLAPEYVQAFRARFPVFKAEGKIHSEFFMMHKDGSRRYISFDGRIAHNADGGFKQTHCILKDETEHKKAEEALRTEKSNLAAMFEGSPIAMLILDETTSVLTANKAAIDMCGRDKASVIHHRPGNALHCANSDAAGCGYGPDCPICPVRRALEGLIAGTTGPIRSAEVQLSIKRDDKELNAWLEVSATELLLNAKRAFCVSLVDITERKQAENALRVSKELLSETERIGKVGGWSFNIDTMLQTWTDEVYRIHEVEIVPNPTVEEGINYYTIESRPIIAKAVQRAIEHGEEFDLDLEIITAKGNTRAVHTIGKADLKNRRIYGFFQDITDYKRAEQALRESEAKFREMVETFPLAIHQTVGVEQITEYMNPTMVKLFGYTQADIPSVAEWWPLAYPDETYRRQIVEEWTKKVKHAIATQSPIEPMEVVCTCKDGSKKNISWGYITLGGKNYSCGLDITARKKAEASISQLHNDLENKHRDLLLTQQSAERFMERLKIATRAAHIGIWDWNIVDNDLIWDNTICELYGVPHGFFKGGVEAWSEFIHPDDRSRALNDLQAALRGEQEYAPEFRIVWPDGSIHDIKANSQAFFENGKPIRMVGTNIDITERKQSAAEAVALKESLDSVAGFVFAKDLDLKYISANRSFCDLLKIPYNKIQGMTDYDIFPADLAAKYIADDKRVIETANEITVEEETINATTNQRFIVQTRKFPRFDSNGRVAGIYGVGHDVTEFKQAEYALKDREYLLNESQKAGNIGSYALDFATNHWQSSEVLDLLLGINRDYPKSIGSWLELVYPDDRQMMDQYFKEEVIAKRKLFNKEYRITRRSDETVRWMHGLGRLSFDKDNNLLCMIGTIQDITAQKQAEAEREKLQSQLAQAQKMESVGRLAGGVAHDFNNMLGVILGQTELAMEGIPPDAPLHEDLKEIQKAARRSADITRQLLAFARKQTVAPKVLDLNETLSGTLKMLERLIGENIEILYKPGHGIWPVKVDPAQVDQILANLCVNARDAITGAGKIIIETGNTALDEDYCALHADFIPGDYVLLSVSDNGSGMDAGTLACLFEPFFTTKETGKGTGLGLATVYGAVKQNNGFINVTSEPGQGTTFNIYLPRHKGQAAETNGPEPQAAEHGSGETILLVEDQLDVLKITTRMLQRLGYQVVAAGTPGEAISLAQENAGKIALLLTDVVMPNMNGRDLAKNLQSVYPDILVLFMSGFTADVVSRHGILHEGMRFIQKPFTMMELGAKLREVFAGRHAGQDRKQL